MFIVRQLASADHHAATIRAAAIALDIAVYVFDLDATPACCNVYFALRPPVKVCKGSGTVFQRVEGCAWSLILGKDKLPCQLISLGQQGRKSVAVLVHASGVYHPCLPLPALSTQPAAEPADITFTALGISLQDVAFKHIHTRGKGGSRIYVISRSFLMATATGEFRTGIP